MKLIIFDTETTGFPVPGETLDKQPYICQFASITIEFDPQTKIISEINRTDQLIKPPITMPPASQAVHGISDQDLLNQPSFVDVADKILALFKDADIAVAHNLPFDQQIFEFELERNGLDQNFLPATLYDSMKETKALCKLPGRNGNFKSPRLMELHQFLLGQPFQEAHNAMKDVEALTRCLVVLLEQGFYQPVLNQSIKAENFASEQIEQISLF